MLKDSFSEETIFIQKAANKLYFFMCFCWLVHYPKSLLLLEQGLLVGMGGRNICGNESYSSAARQTTKKQLFRGARAKMALK